MKIEEMMHWLMIAVDNLEGKNLFIKFINKKRITKEIKNT